MHLIPAKSIDLTLPPGARLVNGEIVGGSSGNIDKDGNINVAFDHSPTLWRFFNSRKRVRILLGPVGSGKTVVSCIDPFAVAMSQAPGKNNVRPFKLAVVRNSMPELWRTTIETWLGIYDESICGMLRRSTPIGHNIIIPDLGDGTSLDFQAEFFGLDRPDQVKALLSYEATMMYFNEMREIPEAIVDAATDRIGRFPSMQKGGVMPTFAGVIGDSNPPDKDHWLYKKFERPPEGWEFFLQPAGVTEVEEVRPGFYRAKSGEPPCGEVPEDLTTKTFAGKVYAVNPAAENLPNLPIDKTFDALGRKLGKGNYYLSRVSGKTQSWIDGYYRNKFTFVVDGQPVIPEFNLEQMALDHLEVLPGVPIGGGYDVGSGTLSPAGIVGQVHPSGIYLIHAEVTLESIGLIDFGEQMTKLLLRDFPNHELEEFFGDPAGGSRDGIHKKSYFDHLRGYGLPVKSAPTNDPETRLDAIKAPMLRNVRGRPGILINRQRCPKLVRGLSGAWHYRRMQVAGEDRFASTPEKSIYSHVCEAAGYWLCGKGEIKVLRNKDARGKRRPPERDSDHDYDYFGG
jgi:hypothetical protein